MKKLCITVLIIAAVSCRQPAAPESTAAPAVMPWQQNDSAIRSVIAEQATAWNNGSIDNFMKGYWHSDSMQFITKRGVIKGWDSVCSSYKRNYDTREKMGRLDFTEIAVMPLDKQQTLAQVTGKWRVLQKDTFQGNFSLIFKKFDTQWRIIIDHTW